MSSSPTPIDRLTAGRPIRLLGVWAHPDDEAYLSAGLMHRVAVAGGRVVCVTVTRGEAGESSEPLPPAQLGVRREAELRASLGEVGAHSLRILGHRDGGLDRVPFEAGVRDVRRAIEAVHPDVIVTFGPDGITGHPDHLAVHRWVTEAWRRTGTGELLYAVLSNAFVCRYRLLHERVGFFGDHRPVGHAEAALDVAMVLDDRELDRKRRALAAHATQTTDMAVEVGESTYRTWWGVETFRQPTATEVSSYRPLAA